MADTSDLMRAEAELQKLRLEVQKLEMELAGSAKAQGLRLATELLPTVTVLVTVLGFVFTVWQYRSEQNAKRTAATEQSVKDKAERDERARIGIEEAQREFMKPLLERQQAIYFEAASAAATVASSSDARERATAVNTFWRLYWGPLVMVESTEVSGAMKSFGRCLDRGQSCDGKERKQRSLALASALEGSLLRTWNSKPESFTADQFVYR